MSWCAFSSSLSCHLRYCAVAVLGAFAFGIKMFLVGTMTSEGFWRG